MLGVQIYGVEFGRKEVGYMDRWGNLWDRFRIMYILDYSTSKYYYRISISKI